MMTCEICNYVWCWICGYEETAWFHRITGQASLCQNFNYGVFGFD